MGAAPRMEPDGRHPIDPEKIPAELRARKQWVVWRTEVVHGRLTKVPYRTVAVHVKAATSRSQTWSSFDTALAAYLKPKNRLEGIGYVFCHSDPFAGVDFDNCLGPDGEVLEWARPYLNRLVAYAEVSPSGRGIKAFVRGQVPDGKGRKKPKLGPGGEGAIEVYDRLRFFTVTSRRLDDGHSFIGASGDELAALHADLFPPKSRPKATPDTGPRPLLTDADLVAKACRAKNGEKFAALWNGSTDGHKSKSEADLSLCSLIAFWVGGDVEAIDRLFRQSGLCDGKWTDRADYREATIAKACERSASYDPNYRSAGPRPGPGFGSRGEEQGQEQGQAAPEPGTAPEPEDTRPAIEVNTERHLVVAASIEALRADPDLYNQAGALVDVVREVRTEVRISARTVIRKAVGMPKVIGLSESIIGCRLTSVAIFHQWRTDKHGEAISVPAHPPDWLIKAIATRKHWPGIRTIEGIAECPFPRPDGSIVDTVGYDDATLTLMLPSIEYPSIPENPTKANAVDAWIRISDYVKEFPFRSEDDKIVFLAGLLTVIGRPAVPGPVPGIAVIGNKASTGKGLLIDAMTIPGTGRVCPTSAYPSHDEEAVKVKVAIAKACKVAVHFDNLDEGASYGSGPLDSALTSTVVDDRELGSNEAPPRLLRCCWFLSGNNVHPAKDAYRRWLVCNLETDLDRPEDRTGLDRPDLRGAMIADRGMIVRDALTILRAHALAGRPMAQGAPGFGSFEEWSIVIRGAVWFATGRDCLTTQRQAAADSPDRTERLALLEALREMEDAREGRSGVTSGEFCKAAEEQYQKPDLTWHPSYPNLRAAMISRGRGGKIIDTRQLGNLLRGLQNTRIGPYRLIKHPNDRHHAAAWIVQVIPESKGESGESGESSSVPPTRDSRFDSDVNGYGTES